MVAQPPSVEAEEGERRGTDSSGSRGGARASGGVGGGLRRLVSSVARLTDIQIQIWATQAKIAAMRLVVYAALVGGASIVGILGVIFVLIGLFHVLTDVVGLAPVWAFLVFGGGQLLLAAILIGVAVSILKKRMAKKADGGEDV